MADNNQKNNTLFSKLQKLFSNKAIVTVDGSGKRKVVDTDDRQRGSTNLVSLRDRYTKLQRGYYGEQMSAQSMAYHQVRRELFRDYDAMDADPVLSSALDIFSDESTLKDEFGDTIKIKTDNSKIKDVLENLFYDVLNIESNLWAWTRNMVKYGDFFLILEISSKKGVINAQPASIYNTERLENTDANNPNYVKFKINYDVNGKTEYENYEVAHFRLLSDTNFLPYGKCLPKTAYVDTETGSQTIDTLSVGQKVWIWNGGGFELSPIKHVVSSGFKDVIEIATQRRQLQASTNHPILVWCDNQSKPIYKQAGDIVVGDLLLVSSNKHIIQDSYILVNKDLGDGDNKNGWKNNIDNIPDVFTEEFALLFGFLIGDGWVYYDDYVVAFSQGVYPETNSIYCNLLEKFSGKFVTFTKHTHADGVTPSQAILSSKLLSIILKNNGLVGDAKTKRIPRWVYESPESVQLSFIRGLIDADGCVNVDKWGCARYSIELSNEMLIRDIQQLLLRLNIKVGKVCHRVRKDVVINNVSVKNPCDSYYLYFYLDSERFGQIKKYDRGTGDGVYTEMVKSINGLGNLETFDIQVESHHSNFVANGIIVHNSQIENARRVWKQLSLMEDAMLIHRIMRAPEKRIFKIDIGNIPPNEVDNYMQKIINRMKKIPFVDRNTGDYNLKYNMQNLTEDFFLPVRGGDSGTSIESLSGLDYSAIEDIEYLRAKLFAALKIPKAYLGYEEDVCISPDTMIPLLSGDIKSVAEIITDFENGVEQYVYSLDEVTNDIVPGKIEWAGMTRRDADVVKVWLDNEEFIVCTPDHKFLKRNGEWVQAKDLSEGDSLMPLYLGKSTNKFIKDYITVYNPRDNKYKMVHRVVAEYFGKISKGKVVHHIDFNKWNNNPDNLDCTMNWKQHRDYHNTMAQNSNNSHAMELYRQSDDFIENQRRNGALGGAMSGKKLGKWVAENGPSNKGIRSGVIKGCKNKNCNKEIYTTVANKNKMYCSRECCYSDETLQLYNTKYNTIGFDVLLEHARTSKSFKDLESRLNVDRNTLNRIFDFHGVDKYDFIYSYMPEALKNKGFINNFKQLEKNHKVVRVELLEHRIDTCDIRIPIYHNFGTAAGVIIHNSGKATIAAEDVRFARTIERIQKTLTSELTKIAIIHLAGLGFDGSDLTDFELSLVNPSTIYEQEKYNLWSEKIRLVNDMKDLRMISKDWIYKNILNMSDTEIEEEKTKVINDLKDMFRYNSIENDGSDPALEADEDEAGGNDDFDSDFPSNDKGGRPREGNTYKTDVHPYGRDPLGSDENSKAMQREGYFNNRSAKKHAKLYSKHSDSKNSSKAIIYEKNKPKRSFMDDSNLIDD